MVVGNVFYVHTTYIRTYVHVYYTQVLVNLVRMQDEIFVFQLKQLLNRQTYVCRPNQKWESSKLVILRPPSPPIIENFRHSSNIMHLFWCKSLSADLGLARWPCFPEVQVQVQQQQISCIQENPIVINSTTKCYRIKNSWKLTKTQNSVCEIPKRS